LCIAAILGLGFGLAIPLDELALQGAGPARLWVRGTTVASRNEQLPAAKSGLDVGNDEFGFLGTNGNTPIEREARLRAVGSLSPAELRHLLECYPDRSSNDATAVAELGAQLALYDLEGAVKRLKLRNGFSMSFKEMVSIIARRSIPEALKVLSTEPDLVSDGTAGMINRLSLDDPVALAASVANGDLDRCDPKIRMTAYALSWQTGAMSFDDIVKKGKLSQEELHSFFQEVADSGGGSGDFLGAQVLPRIGDSGREEFLKVLASRNPRAVLELIESGAIKPPPSVFAAALASEGVPEASLKQLLACAPKEVRDENAENIGYRLGFQAASDFMAGSDPDPSVLRGIAAGAFRDQVHLKGGPDAVKAAAQMPTEAAREGAFSMVFEKWADKEPNTAANAIIEGHFGEATPALLASVLPKWIQRDALGVSEWLTAVAAGNLKPETLRVIVAGLPGTVSPEIQKWLETNPAVP
jgi:hypothetical protein